MAGTSRSNRSGFTLMELMIVVAIGGILAVVGVPNVVVAVSNSRMRASITSFSGVLQSTRMLAVKQNRTITTHMTTRSQSLVAFAKLATDSDDLSTQDMQVEMQAPILKYTAPVGANAPASLTSTQLGFTPELGDPSFNSRGLPCAYASGTCPNHGFVYYFRDTRSSSYINGWAAVSISPAGRIHKWFYNGAIWTD